MIPILILSIAIAWLLRRTMFGRTVFAIGGSEESARRMGMNVRWTKARIYMLVGAISALQAFSMCRCSVKPTPTTFMAQN